MSRSTFHDEIFFSGEARGRVLVGRRRMASMSSPSILPSITEITDAATRRMEAASRLLGPNRPIDFGAPLVSLVSDLAARRRKNGEMNHLLPIHGDENLENGTTDGEFPFAGGSSSRVPKQPRRRKKKKTDASKKLQGPVGGSATSASFRHHAGNGVGGSIAEMLRERRQRGAALQESARDTASAILTKTYISPVAPPRQHKMKLPPIGDNISATSSDASPPEHPHRHRRQRGERGDVGGVGNRDVDTRVDDLSFGFARGRHAPGGGRAIDVSTPSTIAVVETWPTKASHVRPAPALIMHLEAYIARELNALQDAGVLTSEQAGHESVFPSAEFSKERLDIFRNVFESLCSSFKLYKPLLQTIKAEYDAALEHLWSKNAALEEEITELRSVHDEHSSSSVSHHRTDEEHSVLLS